MPAGAAAATTVLSVLADTDLDELSDAALGLHRGLTAQGFEVRTLALGPGRRGELQQRVPTLGPSPSSYAARAQLRREAAWADVVLAWGWPAGAAAARVLRERPPALVVVAAPAGADPGSSRSAGSSGAGGRALRRWGGRIDRQVPPPGDLEAIDGWVALLRGLAPGSA